MIFQMSLNPWVGCEEYDECEQALCVCVGGAGFGV